MKKNIVIIASLIMAMSTHAADKLTIKDITSGCFTAAYVSGIDPIEGTDLYASISNDGKKIISYSFKTGKQVKVLFDTEAAKAPFDKVAGYKASPDGKKMLIYTDRKAVYRRSFTAQYYVYDIKSRKLTPLSLNGAQQVATWSPDSRNIAFVRDNNIFVTDLQSERQITADGKFGEIINGIPDWVNEEEFALNRSFAWNADGTALCWVKYDEQKVKTYSLQMFKGLAPEHEEYSDYPGEYSYKYPKAGQDNASVTAWSYNMNTGKTTKLNVPLDADGYIPRMKTTPDAHSIIVFTMNRHQDRLTIYAVDPFTAEARTLIEESVPKYIKGDVVEWASVGQKYILLPSDRSGFMHLYLYTLDGKMVRQVEDGNYDVTDFYGLNELTGDVYYQAAKLNAHDRQVFVSHADGTTERLSDAEGNNSAIFSGNYRYFVNTWSDYSHPYVFTTRTDKGKVVRVLEDNSKLTEKTQKYNWGKRETFSFCTADGTKLDGWMVKPLDFDPAKKYPVILFQYSGPGSQQVLDAWSAGSMGNGGAFDYYLAQEGYIVACVDGRGTGGRGAEFEKCTYLKLGDLEAHDQVETALYMGTLPYVNKDRIGIWGWSFGGFCTLMSMSEGRPVFRAGVAVAPPTNWKFYDTIYTERYMRTPQENADGYKTNPIERVEKMNGALLVCHGVADDNVHPQNTYEYAEALVQADKDFKEVLYTNRNHGISGGNSRNHLLRQIVNWFNEKMTPRKVESSCAQ